MAAGAMNTHDADTSEDVHWHSTSQYKNAVEFQGPMGDGLYTLGQYHMGTAAALATRVGAR
jgi:hypothetical protein